VDLLATLVNLMKFAVQVYASIMNVLALLLDTLVSLELIAVLAYANHMLVLAKSMEDLAQQFQTAVAVM